MVIRKRGYFITALLITLFSFSAVYLSCTKPLENFKYSCDNVVCMNGGHCDSARCICPVGFEGFYCETGIVNKFLGTYSLRSTIVGSDSANWVNRDTTYNVLLERTATPTTFFIDNFAGDPFYSKIVCILDSSYHYGFRIDTISRTNMVYDHYRIQGGSGYIVNDSVFATVFIRHLDASVNWQNDTLKLRLHKLP